MFVERLRVRNFRNIETAELAFGAGYNVLVGANGQGKTNLLEAVLFLATSTSHRTNRDKDLIRYGQEAAHVLGEVNALVGLERLECGISADKKLLKLQGKPLPRVGDLYGHLRVVLFAPEDLFIIKGSPRIRRKFMDMAIAQIQPDHVFLLQTYRKLLKQRQVILREQQSLSALSPQLDAWEEQLSKPTAEILRRRVSLVRKLSLLTCALAGELSGSADQLELSYRSFCGDPEEKDVEMICREKFRASRERDRQSRQTNSGPHRDDLAVLLGGRDLAGFGSQGQTRTASLALRLAETALIESEVREAPVLLIDDVIFEMDSGRRERFFALLPKQAQGLVTATETDYVRPLVDEGHVFEVNAGSIHHRG